MTQPNDLLPEQAWNFDSLAEIAAKPQEEWMDELEAHTESPFLDFAGFVQAAFNVAQSLGDIIFGLGGEIAQDVVDFITDAVNNARNALEQIGTLIWKVGGDVIDDVGDAIRGTVLTLSDLTDKLWNNAAAVIGAIPQNLVSGLNGALNLLTSGVNAARTFVQQVIDAIMSGLRGIPIIGALIPDLKKSVQQQRVDQQNFTVSAIVSDYRTPSWVCRYQISDVTYPECFNNHLSGFGATDGASAGTAHTHTLGLTDDVKVAPAGWSIAQHESRGSYINIANTTVHDTVGVMVWKEAGTLNNVYLEIFKENTDLSLTRVFSKEFSGSITTTTAFYEAELDSRLIVQSGERYLLRVRNSSSTTTIVRIVGVTRVSSAASDGFKTVGAPTTELTTYTAGQAASARSAGTTLNWFMLAAKNMPSVDRSFSDDANRLNMGGLWARQSSTAALLDIYEQQFGYTGTLNGDQSAIYIHSCTRDVNRVEANLYIDPLSTERCGVLLHCSRDFGQVVYLGVDETSAKIYSGTAISLTERASISVGGTDKWSLYYDEAADKYVALKGGAVIGLEWTSVGGAVLHGADYRFGGIRISSDAGTPAGTIDDWNLRDWYIAVPETVSVDRMTATMAMPEASVVPNVAAIATRMASSAALPAPSLTVGQNTSVSRMASSAAIRNADVLDGNFAPMLVTFDTPGTHTFVIPSGVKFIDRVALAGGRGGRHYIFGASTNGGEAGAFAWDTLEAGIDFNAGDTITITVGAGGLAGGGFGGNTTLTVGADSLTAIGGDTYVSGYSGAPVSTGNINDGKDLSLNGNTYTGGPATNSAVRDNPQPGSGGWGSNSNGVSGRAGGRGQAWLYVRT